MTSTTHLVKRFFASLSRKSPSTSDESWVAGLLNAGEYRLWSQMPAADQRHSIQVAKVVEDRLSISGTQPVLAAALLHDIGKIPANLNILERVLATITAKVVGGKRLGRWAGKPKLRGRLGKYWLHGDLGAEMLKRCGSDPIVIAWAKEHHLPKKYWTLDQEVAGALKAADGD